MSSELERRRRHLDQAQKSASNLDHARHQSAKKNKYSSIVTRQKLKNEVFSRTNGLEAYEWQLDVAEAVILGLDCTVIAGTGAGKTLPFAMPLFVLSRKIVLVISPLNALEEDQAARFRKMGLTAVAVNGDTYSSRLQKDIESGKYQMILSSPEMCLKHDDFRKLLSAAKFSQAICCIVVDEAHCITQWGPQFRPEYAELGDIRAFAPHAPVLLTSATLTLSSLDHARKIMHIDPLTSYHVMLGVDRPNITWSVRRMVAGKSLESLQFIIPPPSDSGSDAPTPIIPTMVFFDDIPLAMSAMVYLRNLLPRTQHNQVAVYNSRRTPRAKKRVMEQFRNQEVKILLTTEAAGMGCDIPHVERVVQFTVPKSLDIWMQRGGRAGRDRSIHAEAILLVQPSVFQEISNKKGNTSLKEGGVIESPQYRKEINDGLRQWIEAVRCRRDIADEYYDSGVPRSAPLGLCCDVCVEAAAGSQSTNMTQEPYAAISGPADPDKDGEDVDLTKGQQESDVASDAKPEDHLPLTKRRDPSILPQRRRGAHLDDAQTSLERWGVETWTRQYAGCPWSPEIILPSRVVSNIANKTQVQSVEDLIEIGGWARHRALLHGEELLRILHEVDQRERDRRVSEKKKKDDERLERKRATEAAREAKKAETKRRREEERLNRPKKPRLSRAKVVKHMAAGIPGKENVPPLSPLPVPIMLPTAWSPMVPFTPPRPRLTSFRPSTHASESTFFSATTPMSSHSMLATQFAPPSYPTSSLTSPSPTLPAYQFAPPSYPTAPGTSSLASPAPAAQFSPDNLPASFWTPPAPTLSAYQFAPPSYQTAPETSSLASPAPAAQFSPGNLPASFWTPPYLTPHMTSQNPTGPLQPYSPQYHGWIQ